MTKPLIKSRDVYPQMDWQGGSKVTGVSSRAINGALTGFTIVAGFGLMVRIDEVMTAAKSPLAQLDRDMRRRIWATSKSEGMIGAKLIGTLHRHWESGAVVVLTV